MADCGSCALCCKLMGVNSLAKPANQWCPHCDHHSCTIYESRPQDCRDFRCYWLAVDGPPELRPDKMHMVIADVSKEQACFVVHVDPAYPRAWAEGKGARMLNRLTQHQPEIRNVALIIGEQRIFLRPSAANQTEIIPKRFS